MPRFVLFMNVDSASKDIYINPEMVVAVKTAVNAKGCSTIFVKHTERSSFTVVGDPNDIVTLLSIDKG